MNPAARPAGAMLITRMLRGALTLRRRAHAAEARSRCGGAFTLRSAVARKNPYAVRGSCCLRCSLARPAPPPGTRGASPGENRRFGGGPHLRRDLTLGGPQRRARLPPSPRGHGAGISMPLLGGRGLRRGAPGWPFSALRGAPPVYICPPSPRLLGGRGLRAAEDRLAPMPDRNSGFSF